MDLGDVWAPDASSVTMVLGDRLVRMERCTDPGTSADGGDLDGVWIPHERPTVGDRYGFVLDDGPVLPDPRSRWQPDGVAALSAVPNLRSRQHTVPTTARPWRDAVIHELHVGTFSRSGTFRGVLDHIDHLVGLGVSHIELMPIAAAPGRFGWGYDGVALWSPHAAYGTPDDLAALIDGCHAAGLAVIVDVVINHLGPDGSTLGAFGPYFTDRYRTPWGDSFNVDGPESDHVRSYLLGSALHWLEEYGADGLRVDAAHAIIDTSATHLLEQLATSVDQLEASTGRPLVTIAEWDRSDPRVITARSSGGYGYTAQWADDLHHAVHATLTGELSGYYEDFDGGIDQIVDVLSHGYAHRGGWSAHRRHHHGRDPGDLPRSRFVVALQNHDQVGNRAAGERLHQLTGERAALAVATLFLLGPSVPMVFQGEDWAASAPFPYFADHAGELADAVRRGRIEEFVAFGWSPEDVLDPIDPATFERARLDWSELEDASHGPNRQAQEWYRTLLELRRSDPSLAAGRPMTCESTDGVVTMRRGPIRVEVNLSDGPRIVAGGAVVALGAGASLDGDAVELESMSVAVLRDPEVT